MADAISVYPQRAYELQQQAEKEHESIVKQTAEENRRKVRLGGAWSEFPRSCSRYASQMEEAERRKKAEKEEEQRRNFEELAYTINMSVAAESPEAAKGQGKW